jgi:hypothetical protein
VPGVERLDETADGAALARGVPALEEDEEGRTQAGLLEEAPAVEAEVEEVALGGLEPREGLGLAHSLREVDVVEGCSHLTI